MGTSRIGTQDSWSILQRFVFRHYDKASYAWPLRSSKLCLLGILNDPWPQFVSYNTPNDDIAGHHIPASPDFTDPLRLNIPNLEIFLH